MHRLTMIRGETARIVIAALWTAWLAYWKLAARDAKPTRWREPPGSRALHVIPSLICVALLVAPHPLARNSDGAL